MDMGAHGDRGVEAGLLGVEGGADRGALRLRDTLLRPPRVRGADMRTLCISES